MSRACRGDEVFFYYKGEPRIGKVVCSGKSGCVIEYNGKQHKLKWDKVAGHKKRTAQSYRILEEGEDGCIVENQDGKRKYLRIPPESRAEQFKLTPQQISGVHK